MADPEDIRSSDLREVIGVLDTIANDENSPPNIREISRRAAQETELAMNNPPQLDPISMHHYPERLVISGMHIHTISQMAYMEREKARPILSLGSFIADTVTFPQWPQIDDGHVQSNTEDQRHYVHSILGTRVRIPVKFLKPEGQRKVENGEDVRAYRVLYGQILAIMAQHLSLPAHMVHNIRTYCLLTHDMRRTLSKTWVYRRWADSRSAPTLYDVVAMYAIGLGRFHPRFRQQLINHGQMWLVWVGLMRPKLQSRLGEPAFQDAPVRYDGHVDMVNPYRAPTQNPVIQRQLQHYDATGEFFSDPDEGDNAMEDLREAVVDLQRVLPAIPAAPVAAAPVLAAAPAIPAIPAAPVLAAARAIPAIPIAPGDIIQIIGQDRRVPRANRFRVLPDIPVLRRRMAGQMQRVIDGPAVGRIRANVQAMSMQHMGHLTNLVMHRLRPHATEGMLVVVILAMSLHMRQMGSTPTDVVATLSQYIRENPAGRAMAQLSNNINRDFATAMSAFAEYADARRMVNDIVRRLGYVPAPPVRPARGFFGRIFQ